MNPKAGGRVVLDLVAAGEAEIRYAAALYTPDAVWRDEVTIGASDGAVRFGPWDRADPPAWMIAFATAFLRSEWKARTKQPSAWPRRLNRWREEKA